MQVQTIIEKTEEKRKDYRNILISQFVIIVIYFTLKDFFQIFGATSLIEYINLFYLLAAATYFFLLWDMIRNFTENKIILHGTLFLLLLNYTIGIIGENPFYKVIYNLRPYYFFLHSTLMIIEATAIFFSIKNLFAREQETSDKLWCSAALYLMIGISFGSLYDIINIVNPGSFGKEVAVGFNSYIEGIYFSMNIQGSGSAPYDNASSLHKTFAVLQSVWNNLYMVMLIGRILVIPADDK